VVHDVKPADDPRHILVAEVPGLGEASVLVWSTADVRRAVEGLSAAFAPDRLAVVVWSVRPPRKR
jgi:hypothetical protein